MTEEIDYKALYEGLSHENEELRVRIAKMRSTRFQYDVILKMVMDALHNGYFWLGYFIAIFVMLLVGAWKGLRDGSGA